MREEGRRRGSSMMLMSSMSKWLDGWFGWLRSICYAMLKGFLVRVDWFRDSY